LRPGAARVWYGIPLGQQISGLGGMRPAFTAADYSALSRLIGRFASSLARELCRHSIGKNRGTSSPFNNIDGPGLLIISVECDLP
jgi:hypothetical protein